MRFGSVAGLVLAGWYLMTPPLVENGSAWDTQASLSKWRVMRAFDTAESCENYSRDFYAHSLAGQPVKQKMFLQYAQYIESDDPRLAKIDTK
jgi:hypothetical protein